MTTTDGTGLVGRLRRVPGDRRAAFLARLASAETGYRPVPLSYRQEQLWVLNRFSPVGLNYNLAFSYHLRGQLDLTALRAALNSIIERHPVLRTVYPAADNGPGRRVLGADLDHLPTEDLTGLPAERRQERIDQAVATEAREPFDLDTGPMVRLRLLRLGAEEHLLLWATHYMAFDPESGELILRELADLYTAHREGQVPAPAGAGPGHDGFAFWQRDQADDPGCAAALADWRDRLAGWQPIDVPPDRTRPALLTFAGDVVSRDLPPAMADRLRSLAWRCGVPVDAVVTAGYVTALARYSRQSDVVVGLTERPATMDGIDGVVGNCGNVVPMRLDLADDPDSVTLAGRAAEALALARSRSQVPFKLVLDAVQPPRDLSRLPLVQVAIDPGARTTATRSAGGVEFTMRRLRAGTATFELLLEVELDAPTPRLHLEFNTALYEPDSMRNLLDYLVLLLAAAEEHPHAPLSELAVSSPQDQERVLGDWNDTAVPVEPDLLHAAFARQAAARPQAVALTAADRVERTYHEVDVAANRLANHLRSLGVGPERRVAVLLPRSASMIESVLAVLKAGGAYVPIDASYPADRIAFALADCGAHAVITQTALAGQIPAGGWRVVDLDADADRIATAPATTPQVEMDPANAAYVIYTSGSTGRPKGVVIEHRNAITFLRSVQRLFAIRPEDRFVQFASLSFDVSVFEIFGALCSGARLHVVDDDERRSLDRLDRILAEQEITITDLPPALMELFDPGRYPHLRVAFVGGEAFSGDLTTRWAAGRDFYNGYGPTEVTVTVVAKHCTGTWHTSPPIGRPMDNTRAYTVDERLGMVPIGVPAELALAGTCVGRGYLDRPELTAERFRPDPYGPPGSRMYLTGDLARWRADGDLVFLGRIDRQVKIRGLRIELGEVEAHLCALPQVAQAVVQPVTDPQGNTLLAAYLVASPGADPQADQVRDAMLRTLPPYLVPSAYLVLDRIPLTPSGKTDTRALPPVDFAALVSAPEEADDLRSPTERRVADEIFAPLLSLPRVGLHDNFFALGGTSLQAIRVIPRIQAAFGVELPVAGFFQTPTVAGVAAAVDGLLAVDEDARQQDLLAALELVESSSDEDIERMLAEQGPAT